MSDEHNPCEPLIYELMDDTRCLVLVPLCFFVCQQYCSCFQRFTLD